MTLEEFHRIVDSILPPEHAVSGDAIGLQIGSERNTATNILTCLEVTDDVVSEAIEQQCDVIVTFHPLIYSPMRQILRTDRVGRCTARLIASDISLLSVHTAFDAFPHGTNAILASAIGIVDLEPLPGADLGILGTWPTESFDDLLTHVSTACSSPIRFVAPPSGRCQRIAVVAGSGMSLFPAAVNSGADVFVTADVKYHGFFAAADVIGLIDPGHWEMERFVPEALAALLSKALPDITVTASRITTNPASWYHGVERHSPAHSQVS